MQLDPSVAAVQRDLAAALPEQSPAASEAERLAAALDSSLRLALITALSQATDELNAELAAESAAGTVTLQLSGGEPRLVASGWDTTPVDPDSIPTQATQAPAGTPDVVQADPPTTDGETARYSLRLPEHLKTGAEAAATRAGLSLNAWLVRAVATALAGGSDERNRSRTTPPTRHVTGWMN